MSVTGYGLRHRRPNIAESLGNQTSNLYEFTAEAAFQMETNIEYDLRCLSSNHGGQHYESESCMKLIALSFLDI
jgi:hypothetical protein